MIEKIKIVRPIKTLDDLRLKKEQLKKKAYKKEQKITKKVKKITKKSNVQNIYNEILSEFNLQHSILNMLPLILKYKNKFSNIKISEKNKKTALIAIGTVATGLLTYLLLSKKQSNPDSKNNNNFEDLDENLFI
ncbi:MAG: hypothetical protein JXR51_04285 [Bacteroidales bacterium]|nr:hypothetical protein [Bacteroidales bacterium]MBN2756374.1 hypothetical protein [Bacteroidales bacterium]